MQRVIGAVADGDLSKKVSADVRGEMLDLKNTINAMVDQLNGFASEVTRVAREVGTEGKLGQAAAVTIEVGGVWKDLTDNVNLMAGNLTGQVRNIAEVTTAVANGDLSKKISIDVKGEFLQLKNTVNAMVDQLNAFAGEVTRVAREVGVEGKLGGQAQSTEVSGVWKDLTDNVNQLAANLTNQVRAIAEVATAVTEGDLTRQVSVEASGEVAVLKDLLNEMIRNLRETTRQNVEQDWLKTNRERFTRMLQGQDDLTAVSSMILSELATLVSAQHGVFYSMIDPVEGGEPILELQAGYGYEERKQLSTSFELGEGLVGQCAKEKKRILLTEVPGDYVRINSGLGSASPLNIMVLPVLFEGSLRAVIELASFSPFTITQQTFLDSVTESIGITLSTIEAAGLTESLLKQSQSLAEELRSQQEELRESNADLERQATLLAEQNIEAGQRNLEIEESKRLVEEKAGQLSVSSKYKSEFIANMSHELRTPLNSLLILAEQLEENPEHNMTDTQVQYASVIHSSGKELLELLNSILDLAKVESGTVTAELADFSIDELRTSLLREFEPVAQAKGIEYSIEIAPESPDEHRHRPATAPADPEEPARQRLQVHRARHGAPAGRPGRPRLEQRAAVAQPSVVRGRNLGHRYRDRDRRGATAADLRSVRPGRRHDRPPLRRYRPRPLDQPRAGRAPRRRDHRHQHARSRQHVHRLPAGGSGHDRPARPGADTMPATDHPAAPIADERAHPRARSARHPTAPTRAAATTRARSQGVRILVVDDDIRNIFAMTALLERGRADVTVVESGADALAALEREADVRHRPDGHHDAGHGRLRDDASHPRHRSVQVACDRRGHRQGDRRRTAAVPRRRSQRLRAEARRLRRAPRLTAALAARQLGPPDVRPPPPASGAAEAGGSAAGQSSRPRRPRAATRTDRPNGRIAIPLDGLTILVVDDDFRNIFAMTALLERGRANVVVAESGAEAIAALGIDTRHRPRPDGHHDAGHGRLRGHARHPRDRRLPVPPDHRRHRQGGIGRTPALPRRRSERLHPEAGRLERAAHCAPAVAAGAARRRMSPQSCLARPAAARVPILVVDDNASKRLAIKAVLAPLGYSIVEADSGVAALRCITAQDFAVILLDVRMPIMGGIETAALIRQRQQSEMTPIIFITAHGSDELVHTDRYAQGAVDFIFAPVPPDELRAKVSVFANLFTRAEDLAAQAREIADVRGSAETPDRRRADRDLPDRRREPLRLHQPALVGDHRDPARRGTGQQWDEILASAEHAGLIAELPDGEQLRR